MQRIKLNLVILLSAVVFILCLPVTAQQQASTAIVAPVPPAIYAARKVFISNAGSDSGLFPQPFSGDPDRGYREFYADVQSMNRFDLVTSPEDADLVFELRLMAPNGPSNANKENGASDPLPMFRLVIYDRKSHYVLWALTESIDPAIGQKSHDRNFDLALMQITQDLKNLTTPVSSTNP